MTKEFWKLIKDGALLMKKYKIKKWTFPKTVIFKKIFKIK